MFARPSIRLIVLLVSTLALAVPVKNTPPGEKPPKPTDRPIEEGRILLVTAAHYTKPTVDGPRGLVFFPFLTACVFGLKNYS